MGRKRRKQAWKDFPRQASVSSSSQDNHLQRIAQVWRLGSTRRMLIWPKIIQSVNGWSKNRIPRSEAGKIPKSGVGSQESIRADFTSEENKMQEGMRSKQGHQELRLWIPLLSRNSSLLCCLVHVGYQTMFSYKDWLLVTEVYSLISSCGQNMAIRYTVIQ